MSFPPPAGSGPIEPPARSTGLAGCSTAQLALSQVTRTYDRHGFTLGPIDLTLGAGVTCLVGPNGAGKSTLFRLAAGLDRPSGGRIDIRNGEGAASLGYLPQEPTLPLPATCAQFLDYVAWLQGVPKHRRPEVVATALRQVGLTGQAEHRIRSISGGMARRLGVASALVHGPAVVLLDEPTVGLDPLQRVAIRETVAAVGVGRVVLVSTHLVEDVRTLADRVLVLNHGSLVFDGGVAELERLGDVDAPGDSDLERAVTTLIAGQR